ncbi:immunoglobulin domain-containing protein, partial [Klebsiella pneumoniae]|uniref:immunoglobulin domain-containing protein n=1 Tax=Klebsiella pneumoniae TaxID=573 RepID=UPI003A846B2B
MRVSPAGPLTLPVGEMVTLDCSVSGKPRPSVSWIRRQAGGETELVSTTTDS